MKCNVLCLSLVSALTLMSATTQANAPKTGIYLGAALGGAALTGKSTLDLSRNNPGLGIVPSSYTPTISDKNVSGDLFVGFGKRINCVWLAAEVLGTLTSLNSKSPLDITPTVAGNNGQFLQIKSTNAWGGTVNVGYHINQASKLYIKLGVEIRKFKTQFNGTLPVTDPTILNLNANKNSTAFVPGLGLETELNPRFSLRVEYRTALHNGKTVQVANSTPQFTSVKTKPTIHYINLGLTFKI